jgi:hypothetical protein
MPYPKKPNRRQFQARVDLLTPEKLSELAIRAGFVHGAGGATGQFLDALVNSNIVDAGETLVIIVNKNLKGD